jgi:Abnormal spindle-like microcephaly-assoc'd, ASPM-SPD-2-Hydin
LRNYLVIILVAASCGLYGCGGASSVGSQPTSPSSPNASLSVTTLSFGNQVVGTSQSLPITLTNSGTAALNLSIVASAPFAQMNNCGTSLAAAANCTITVTFAPTAPGNASGTVTLTDNAAGSPQVISLTGTSTAQTSPGVSFSTTSLTFGNQTIGTTSQALPIVLTNSGTAALTISSIAASANFAQTSNCAASLAAAASCTINVTFTPAASGSASGTVTVTDNATGSPQVVSLTGTGAQTTPGISFSPTSLSFGNQAVGTTSQPMSVTLTNSGNGSLTISAIAASADFAETNTCGPTLASGANCTINVTFTPTVSGSASGTVTVTDNAAGSPQSVAVSGTGTVPAVSFSPTSLSFGNQTVGTTSASLPVTLTNTGAATLNISGIAASAAFAQTNNCGATLAAAANCTINVTFTPSVSGSASGTVSVTDNASGSPQTVSLTGTGTVQSSPGVSFSPTSLSFGNQVVGTSSQPLPVTLTNSGTAALTISTISATTDFTQTNNCGSSLAAAASCTINVTYSPDSTGSLSGTLSVTDNASGSPQTVSLSGTGITQATGVTVTTYHNDNGRTGQNLQETILNPSNVNTTSFGKLFSQATDGYSYSQPLYVPSVAIPGQGTHNVIYAATMNDSVYAFDADSSTGSNAQPLWMVNFTNPGMGITTVPSSNLNCTDPITTQVGIMSTPVIDTTSNTIYVVARTLENGTYFFRLHALDITTGAEKFGGPVVIEATVPGTGKGSSGGNIAFSPLLENQRAALLLQNGLVYVSFGSLCDYGDYHGWMFAYTASTLAQNAVWLTTPNGEDGAIWQAGNGPAGDSSFNTFISVANGSFDVDTGGSDYGQSVVKVAPPTGGSFPVLDYFTTYDALTYNLTDLDIGSSGLSLLPDQTGPYPHLLVQGDKAGDIFLVNRDNMGQYNGTDDNQIVQFLPAADNGMWSSPAWWNNYVYVGASGDYLKGFAFNTTTGLLSTTPTTETIAKYPYPGTTVSISSNGPIDGIVWAMNNGAYLQTTGEAFLIAYDATNLSTRLYSTSINSTRDNPGAPVKMSVPTVVNGKVYIMTQTALVVYGLLN